MFKHIIFTSSSLKINISETCKSQSLNTARITYSLLAKFEIFLSRLHKDKSYSFYSNNLRYPSYYVYNPSNNCLVVKNETLSDNSLVACTNYGLTTIEIFFFSFGVLTALSVLSGIIVTLCRRPKKPVSYL